MGFQRFLALALPHWKKLKYLDGFMIYNTGLSHTESERLGCTNPNPEKFHFQTGLVGSSDDDIKIWKQNVGMSLCRMTAFYYVGISLVGSWGWKPRAFHQMDGCPTVAPAIISARESKIELKTSGSHLVVKSKKIVDVWNWKALLFCIFILKVNGNSWISQLRSLSSRDLHLAAAKALSKFSCAQGDHMEILSIFWVVTSGFASKPWGPRMVP